VIGQDGGAVRARAGNIDSGSAKNLESVEVVTFNRNGSVRSLVLNAKNDLV